MSLSIIILAAGQGKRMRSSLPKVLHTLGHKPLLAHVIDTARSLDPQQICVVFGHAGDQVKAFFSADKDICWAEQAQQLGTGHALQQAQSALQPSDTVLVLYGDVPLIKQATLQQLIQQVNSNTVALLTAELDDPSGYGRIVRDGSGKVSAIVEHKDANTQQRLIEEINTGVLALPANPLEQWLSALSNDNAQGEYYLTDIIELAVKQDFNIATTTATDYYETLGVNSRQQLAELESYYQQQQADQLMSQGVNLRDPTRVDVRGQLQCGQDVEIDVGVIFEGNISLGDNVKIGPYCVIKNSTIAAGASIHSHSVIEDAHIGKQASVGPYARLRPGTSLLDNSCVGNFVEIKNSQLGISSKVNHLSYVGDSEIGEAVNIGAGAITCNYDGVNKHKTIIKDNSFIGSNTALVAPVTIETGSTVGAGSTITEDTKKNSLVISRARQTSITGWQRPKKKT